MQKKPSRLLAPLLLLVACAVLLGQACRPTPPPAGPRVRFTLPLVEHPNRTYSLADSRGKVTIVAFVASWCVPCQMILPRMLKVQALYGKDKVALIGVATDRRIRFAREFKQALQIPFPMVVGNAKAMKKAGLPPVPVVPLLYVLDRDGRIRFGHKGPVTTKVLAQEVGRVLDLGR